MTFQNHHWDLFGKTNADKFVDLAELLTYDQVIVTDYSLFTHDMRTLHQQEKLIWFDHHQHSIKVGGDLGYGSCPGRRDTRMSATALVYMHMEHSLAGIEQLGMKRLIDLVNTYDMWLQTDGFAKAVALNYFLMTMNMSELSYWLAEALEADLSASLLAGINVGKYIRKSKEAYHDVAPAHGGHLGGYPVVAYNYINSLSAELVPAGAICLMYVIKDKDTVKVSLRSKSDIDVAHLAKQYGGGGHPQAAGFTCNFQTLETFL